MSVGWKSNTSGGVPDPHAPSHSDEGTDEITAEDLATSSATTTHVLSPDGSGGLVMRAEVGGDPLPLGGDLTGDTDTAKVINVGLDNIVTSYVEFVAAANVSSAVGVHTVTGRVQGSGAMVLPAGESIVYAETGFLTSKGHAQWTITGDLDGPLISGPVSASYIDVTNINVGADSFCIEVSSAFGRLVQLDYVGVVGIRGIHLINIQGFFIARTSGTIGSAALVGFRMSGVLGTISLQGCGAVVATVPSVLFEIDATAVISALVQVTSGLLITPVVQNAFAISTGAVFGPGAFLQITGGGANGPQNRFFRQLPGDRTPDDINIVVKGVASAPNWTANSDADRLDLINALTVVLPVAPSAPVPVPYSDGVNPAEITAASDVRFTLFKDPTDVNRWWEEYDGPIPDAPATAVWTLFYERVGGGNGLATACVEINRSEVLESVQQDDGGVFTDFTIEAEDGTFDDVPLTPDPLAIGDAQYFGSDAPFETLNIDISQSGVGAYTLAWEYWSGASFVAVVGLVDGTTGFTAAPGRYDVDHVPQVGWASTSINGVAAFYMRARVTGVGLTTQPRATSARSYAGFVPIPTTIGGIENRAEKQNAEKGGSVNIDPRDRFRPAIQNQGGAQSVLVYDVGQKVRVSA